MLVYRSRYAFLFQVVAALAASLCGGAGTARAQVLYSENFDDEMFEMGTASNMATFDGGFASFDDMNGGSKARVSVLQNFTAPVMTFSFDTVAPVMTNPENDLVLRAGVGTGADMLSSGDQIIEAIVFRNGNRGAFTNNGNETIFLVANNQSSPITFASPIDGTDVTLNGFFYVPYVRNNETDTFGLIKAIDDFNGGPRLFTRMAVGNTSNVYQGTSAIDNLLVVAGVSFEQEIGPEPIPGDTDGDMVVELEDFDPIRDNFRKMVSSRSQGDIVRNGVVDLADFKEWKTAFLGAGGSVAGVDFGFLSNVPEPGTIQLVLLAAVAAAARRNPRVRSVGVVSGRDPAGHANP